MRRDCPRPSTAQDRRPWWRAGGIPAPTTAKICEQLLAFASAKGVTPDPIDRYWWVGFRPVLTAGEVICSTWGGVPIAVVYREGEVLAMVAAASGAGDGFAPLDEVIHG